MASVFREKLALLGFFTRCSIMMYHGMRRVVYLDHFETGHSVSRRLKEKRRPRSTALHDVRLVS